MTEMAKAAELANYRWWDEPEGVPWGRFNHMKDTAITPQTTKDIPKSMSMKLSSMKKKMALSTKKS